MKSRCEFPFVRYSITESRKNLHIIIFLLPLHFLFYYIKINVRIGLNKSLEQRKERTTNIFMSVKDEVTTGDGVGGGNSLQL